ncbi:hypothetical protein O5D80_001608 [Batrachochytrium dendrobatidis]|nr:hypothetical protein O5D80_001608 [Batrachochytrium dendrobatidis]
MLKLALQPTLSTNGIGIDNLSPIPVVVGVEKKLETLEKKPRRNVDDSEHDDIIQKAEFDLEDQRFKFDKLRKDLNECEFKIGRLAEKKWEIDKQIVGLVFGTPLDLAEVARQAYLIRETPSVKKYLKLKSFKYKSFGKKSGGRRKH